MRTRTSLPRLVLNGIGARWAPLVLATLGDEPLRFGELKSQLGTITAKVLTETLRSLERDGLIRRTKYEGTPPAVEYALTELGHSLLIALAAVQQWVDANLPQVLEAQARFAAAG